MGGMQLGCCVGVEQVELAGRSGFDFVELQVRALQPESDSFALDSIRETLVRAEIPVLSFNVLLPSTMKIVGQSVNRTAYEAYLQTAMRRIRRLGGDRVCFGSGAARSCPPDFPKERAREQIVEFIKAAASAAESYGIQVNIEPLNRTECNMINSLQEGELYVREAAHPRVGLLADLYHMQLEGEPVHSIAHYKSCLGHVHVADRGRRHPGSGDYPFGELAAELKEVDYRGAVSVECVWNDAENEMPKAASFLRTIFT